MSEPAALHLFEGYGIELEYMIVDRESLAVLPIADKLMAQVGGGYDREVSLPSFKRMLRVSSLCWSRWEPGSCRRPCIRSWIRTASCGCGRTKTT